MDRRKVLKNVGTGIGAITFTPSLLSLFQSCKQETTLDLKTFSIDQYSFVTKLMDIIIPKTETPGAIELNLNRFIDIYIDEVWPGGIKKLFLLGLDKCSQIHLNTNSKVIITLTISYKI